MFAEIKYVLPKIKQFYPFKRNGISHCCHSSPFRFQGCWMVFFIFYSNFNRAFYKKHSGDADQMPCFAASDLGLQCLSMSDKKEARHIWVNLNNIPFATGHPDKMVLKMNKYSYFQQKRMLRVLKQTISIKWFFGAPITRFN